MAASLSAQVAPQRLPRETRPVNAAVQGIVRNQAGFGLGGVNVTLSESSGTRRLSLQTTGDGVYRLLDLPPGTYDLTIESAGFEIFRRSAIDLKAGDLTTVSVNLQALATGPENPRGIPRQPGMGPLPESPPAEAVQTGPYRTLPQASTAELSGERLPLLPLAADEAVFTAVPNRWGLDYPAYKRYDASGEYPIVVGHLYNPFNRNKLKGDYPIFGNQTFLNVTLASDTFVEGRRLPTPSGIGSDSPDSARFFGRFGQFFTSENLSFSFDLFHGDAAFRPIDWRIKFTPEVNVNYLMAHENGIVNIDVRKGTTRTDAHLGLQEAFIEVKLKDLSHAYDFTSVRAGIQSFNSDFRGFIFSDQEPGLRIFGNLRSNRYQYNLAYFSMLEKDTNSGLNRLDYRHQQVFIANLYRQDFIKPGYTIQVSFHYDKDDPSFKFDENNFLVRPAPIGAVKPHAIRAFYYGLTGDGHLGKLNLTHAFYQVLGHDSLNPIAGKRVDINAQMAAAELSLDRDWLRYRVSFFFASGDKDPRKGTARGFDAIFDSPNFAGGIFSFWNREGIRLTGTGVGLVSPSSLLPSLRSSKSQGQANFVNPGLYLLNAGTDIDISPKLRAFVNLNLVRFVRTAPLELLLFQRPIHAGVGADSGIGVRYRPPLTDNIVITAGVNSFQPFQGFRDIYTGQTLLSAFINVRFQF
ncbi:MAG: carboxypeptidase-like regulatory domain-containing protein [Acidobacteriota bacterium]|nr:carboxypeptidase-like regulatory domain-containing protein [Acidobacteriota bacterium]